MKRFVGLRGICPANNKSAQSIPTPKDDLCFSKIYKMHVKWLPVELTFRNSVHLDHNVLRFKNQRALF